MDRETKFRGKVRCQDEIFDGLWWIGDLLHLGDHTSIAPIETTEQIEANLKRFDNNEEMEILPTLEVDPETVGEFTGHKDKSGRDIFEGSGGVHEYYGPYWVKYGRYASPSDRHKNHIGFYVYFPKNNPMRWVQCLGYWSKELDFDMNIHDDKEILKDQP